MSYYMSRLHTISSSVCVQSRCGSNDGRLVTPCYNASTQPRISIICLQWRHRSTSHRDEHPHLPTRFLPPHIFFRLKIWFHNSRWRPKNTGISNWGNGKYNSISNRPLHRFHESLEIWTKTQHRE